ncbi:MAG: phosphoesterase [Acidobacteria bacterium]|nr:phosphoesterase [Acidobacteriota bacterium]
MKVRLCYHDRCFDGAGSAAVFQRFYQERIRPDSVFHYRGLTHRASALFDDDLFDGDENVIVDFKYSASPRLTWWFDHHQSAFLSPQDAEHFRRDTSGRKFYDASYRSCTKFLAHVARDRFGFDPSPLAELIQWADIIDGAQYESAEAAVEMNTPATQIALVLEAGPDDDFSARLIPQLARGRLSELAREPEIAAQFEKLYRWHQDSIAIIHRQAEYACGVVTVDLIDQRLEGYNKFVPYYLFPDSRYSVGLSRSPDRVKVAVGSNPWSEMADEKNLASICERYGGGGHARVAAISFEPRQVERARQVAREIAEELRRS